MSHHRFPDLYRLAACAVFVTLVAPVALYAEDASPWEADAHSQLRLIAGSNRAGQDLRAGIDLELAPGWKTYWRYPGDSGVPPRFDFSASTNVALVEVLWPAPARFSDGGGFSIGYHDHVVLPLRIVPSVPGTPVQLRLKLSYAICEKLCVPAEGQAELTLRPGPSTLDNELAVAEARVPKPEKVGAEAPLAIRAVRRVAEGDHGKIIVDVAAPKDVPVDLFAEGPTAEWALPLPEPRRSASPDLRSFAFELDGLPPDTKPEGAELTFTLTAGTQAIESKARLGATAHLD
jgi:DsbC/DsbD-like thiol-disulfide interchange protein